MLQPEVAQYGYRRNKRETTLGPDEAVVHGCVSNLIQEIRRSLGDVNTRVNELNAALSHLTPTRVTQGERATLQSMPDRNQELRTFPEFTRRLADTLILLSTQRGTCLRCSPGSKARSPSPATMGIARTTSHSRTCSTISCTTDICSSTRCDAGILSCGSHICLVLANVRQEGPNSASGRGEKRWHPAWLWKTLPHWS